MFCFFYPGNMTCIDRQHQLDTRSECDDRNNRFSRLKDTKYDELSSDHYYKHVDNKKKIIYTRQILLCIQFDYFKNDNDDDTVSVNKGDVVVLLSDHIKNWFLIQKNNGHRGFIPAKIANHGFI